MLLRNGKFTDEVLREYECNVCFQVLVKPTQIDPCNHNFCESCLRKVNEATFLTGNSWWPTRCPVCRRFIRKCKLNKQMQTKVRRAFLKLVKEREEEIGVIRFPLPPKQPQRTRQPYGG